MVPSQSSSTPLQVSVGGAHIPQSHVASHIRRPLDPQLVPTDAVPTELNPVSLPPYVIEPPDIILIDAVKIVPKSPYKVDTFDHLQIIVTGTLIDQPISGNYQVEPEGTVDLMMRIGEVMSGQPIPEAARPQVEAMANKEDRVVLRIPPEATFETAPKHLHAGDDGSMPDHGLGATLPWHG